MAALLVAAALAAQFNLVCTGESYTSKGAFGPREDVKPLQIVYRIDLNRGRWCSDNCASTEQVDAVTETQIQLSASQTDISETLTTVNRETGSLLSRARFGSVYFMSTGECKKAEFTGFPATKF